MAMIGRPITWHRTAYEVRDEQRRPRIVGDFYFHKHRIRQSHRRVQSEFQGGEGNRSRGVDDADALFMPSTGSIQSSGTGEIRITAPYNPVQPHSVDDAVGYADQNSIYCQPPLIVFHQFHGPNTEGGAEVVQPFIRHLG
jgi:hypothetical protein